MTEETKEEAKKIKLPEQIIIRELAAKLERPVTEVIGKLMMNGILSSQNEAIDFDTATIIANEFGTETEATDEESSGAAGIDIDDILDIDNKKTISRPPVVVVMGHVDHGKTKLLDAIRETNVVDTESGSITQHIGAYQAKEKDSLITFIDTPGHEAFTAMRSRGAKVADIAILVVAADDGIQPQTEEAIRIIQTAKLPFIVAINKIDKPDADIEKVKKDLADHNLLPEDWGGQTITVPISAKQKKNIKDLLAMILLVADMEKDNIKGDPKRAAVGTIIESHVDQGEGPVATVLIQTGTLRLGDFVKIGDIWGKVRDLKNDKGISLKEALPSMPVRVLGIKGAPVVGDVLMVTSEEAIKDLKKKKQYRQDKHLQAEKASTTVTKRQVEEDAANGQEKKKAKKVLHLSLKADTLGSLEAIKAILEKFTHDEVGVEIASQGLGNITEADVLNIESEDDILRGFNVQVSPAAEKVAKGKDIEIITYKVIYDLAEEIRQRLEAMLSPEIIYNVTGKVKILQIFRTTKKDMIIGGKVTEGEAKLGATVRVKRKDDIISEGRIGQLQKLKEDAKVVKDGNECGMKFDGPPLIEKGDIIEFIQREEHIKKLTD
ncbi:MAG: translation initiation factor IF-2 [Patescibacteria group bacterium]